MTTSANLEVQNSAIPTGTWTIDQSHSEIGFVVRHLLVSKVRGAFEKFSGVIELAPDFSLSKIEVSIQAASVNTREEARDNHLRSKDFFGSEENPNFIFTSTAVRPTAKESFFVDGDLTMNGITKPVTLNVEFNGTATDPYGNQKAGFSATAKISRKQWGMQWNAALESGGVLVSDAVDLVFEIQALLKV